MLDLFPRARRSSPAALACLDGGGDMGERIRAFDWTETELGAPAAWPAALQVALRQMLATPQPMAVLWGPTHATLVNDACRPLMGAHATGLGMPLASAWPELWPQVAGCLDRCANGGGWTAGPVLLAVGDEPQAEGHFRIIAAPLADEAGAAHGFLCTFVDASAEVIATRELALLEALGNARVGVGPIEAACHAAVRALATDAADLPFCGLYTIDAARGRADLVACTGIAAGHALMPATLTLDADGPFPIAQALASGAACRAPLAEGASGVIPCGPWSRPPREVVAVPLDAAIWVAALNPFRRWDARHGRILELVAERLRVMLMAPLGSERLYRAIGESIDYGVWLADAGGNYTYTSDSFLRLLGVSLESWAGTGWRDIVHPDDMPGLVERWRHCVATGEQLDREFRVRCADGTWRTILGRGVPVRDERGAIVSWAGINLDIERLKHVENDLREHDRRKDEFLATLAHELRNPLAPLRNGLEVMRLAQGNAEMVGKARGMMERQLAQMVRLIDDLLDVSRVSRGKIELRREPVELATVLRNAVETSQPLMNQRGHDLVLSVPPESIRVDADVTRLSQVFWNLLNNAAKYTEPGGRIDLRVRAADGQVAITIRDNGIGIPPEMQSRVFDIFTQVDRSLEKSQGGLGIGLSIAKRLVEMHGGTIKVRSEGHRKGSEFVVTLPAVAAAKSRDIGSDTGPHVAPGGPSRRILVADDNMDSATTLALMLEVMGNQVRMAHDGEEAFAAAAEFRPDVILLDIGMPKMNGYGACEMIRAQPWGREPHIVALTGWGQDEDKNRSREAGFDRHLVKPVEPAMLEQIIRALPVAPARAS